MQESCTPSVATYPNEPDITTRHLWRCAQVLERGWTPPLLVGREALLDHLHRSVLSRLAPLASLAVSIQGPRGSGTSTVAAHLAATAKDRLSRPGAKGTPLVLRVDTSAHRSPSALVTALFHEIDPSYNGRGASAEFSLLLFLRRLRTLGRPTVLLFDQIGAKVDLSRVLRPLAQPDGLMPEGAAGLPSVLVITAGARDPFPEDVEATRMALPPVRGQLLHQAITQRANLAFQATPSPGAIAAIADLSVAQGWGLSMTGELLTEAGRRAEARGSPRVEAEDVAVPANVPRHGADAEGFGAIILEVLRTSASPLKAGELRRKVATRCEEVGIRGPTQARLWRHVVGLERKGLILREVRLGGVGGSSSTIRLVEEMCTPAPAPREA